MSKSDAYIRVECDTCHDTIEVELLALAAHGTYDERNVDAALQRLGWRDEGDNIHTCDGCLDAWEGE